MKLLIASKPYRTGIEYDQCADDQVVLLRGRRTRTLIRTVEDQPVLQQLASVATTATKTPTARRSTGTRLRQQAVNVGCTVTGLLGRGTKEMMYITSSLPDQTVVRTRAVSFHTRAVLEFYWPIRDSLRCQRTIQYTVTQFWMRTR